ncbi:MAG: nucleotidyltransferase domain-containing protein [Gemmatimonadota bacterium]
MPLHSLSTATRDALADWAAEAACLLVVLFGSMAKDGGTQRHDGDVDLALWFPHLPGPEERLKIMGRLQDLVGARRVDVIFLHRDTSPVLRFEIFRGGAPLYESRPGLFTEQVVRALALYEDAIPFRRALLESFRKKEGAAS